eukprot:463695-Pelagomonas_calceolata.AAC.1
MAWCLAHPVLDSLASEMSITITPWPINLESAKQPDFPTQNTTPASLPHLVLGKGWPGSAQAVVWTCSKHCSQEIEGSNSPLNLQSTL